MRFRLPQCARLVSTLHRPRLGISLLAAIAGAAIVLPLQGAPVSAAPPAEHAVAATTSAGSDVVFQYNAHGNPIRPDADRARGLVTEGATALTFTYNSPAEPWTPDEVAWLTTATSAIYPVARAILGNPAFTITVNISKNSSLGTGGLYNPSINEIEIPGLLPDVLAHEIVHAFHDDWAIMGTLTYEEGMARAAEVEILDRLPQYETGYWDAQHSYYEDTLYDMLDTQSIGSYAGNVGSGFNELMRYELAGYAWGKAIIEKPTFLASFNSAYYARMRTVGSVTEADLITIAAAVKPTVEGLPFRAWYRQQGVLNTRPPIGYFLMFEPGVVGLMLRASDTWEQSSFANTPLQWSDVAADGTVLSSGTAMTNQYGWFDGIEPWAPGYDGRVTVRVTATAPDGTHISGEYFDVRSDHILTASGIYGVIPGITSGTVTIKKLDAPTSSTTVPVVNGAFAAPTLETARGQFLVTFSQPGSPSITRRLTKDASSYYVLLASPNLGVRLTDSPDPAAAGQPVVYTASITNAGPENATGIILRLTLPAGTTVTAMAAGNHTCAVYVNVPYIDTVICRMGTLQQGGGVTARITYVRTVVGPTSVTATVESTETDRATANNIATQVTQIH